MKLEIPRFSHSLFFLSADATPTPRSRTPENPPPFLMMLGRFKEFPPFLPLTREALSVLDKAPDQGIGKWDIRGE